MNAPVMEGRADEASMNLGPSFYDQFNATAQRAIRNDTMMVESARALVRTLKMGYPQGRSHLA